MEVNFHNDNEDLWEIKHYEQGGSSRSYIGPVLDQALVEKIANHKGISNYCVSANKNLCIQNITSMPGFFANLIEEETKGGYNPTEQQKYYDNAMHNAFHFIGCNDSSLTEYFRTNGFELIEGRHINNKDRKKIIISESIAQENNLKIGDTVLAQLNAALIRPVEKPDEILKEYNLDIVGIYRINAKQGISYYTIETDIADNFIFVDLETCMDAKNTTPEDVVSYKEAVFFVDDPTRLDTLIEDIKANKDINWYYYKLTADDTLYKAANQSLKLMEKITFVLLLFIIVICVILLTLICTSNIRGRLREIGIYLSVGIKKGTIVKQFILEGVILGIIAVTLSVGCSKLLIKPISNAVVKAYTPEEEEPEVKSKEELEKMLLEQKSLDIKSEIILPSQMPDKLECTISLKSILYVSVIVLAAIIVSTSLAVWREVSFNPKNILNNS
ncbi:ABC transporter permease [Anaerolentibacter hominis]|uniref:ABC transporter permease n=1 Tax=Anaerolentibacter hominis TaxID=3079009 RepID=UPI0031B8861E